MHQFRAVVAGFVVAALCSACGGGDDSSSSEVSSESSNGVSSSSEAASSSSANNNSSSSSVSPETGVNIYTDLPAEMRISADGERLERGGFYSSNFFDETTLETIYIDFDQADYKTQLANNYESKVEIPATLTYKDKVLEQVGVRYRGLTSYSFAGDKKSFSVDLEYAIEGQDINGYNELKLNNGYEDPSNMREVLYSNLARKNHPSAKANFVKVVVNGENFGVYASVQKLEKDHVKEWFLDKDATRWRAETPGGVSFGGGFGDFGGGGGFGGFGGGGFGGGGGDFGAVFGAGTSTLNNLGSEGSAYEEAYTLKSSDVEDPWQDLANAAYTMGVTSPEFLVEELSKVMDIDAALWFIATENIFTDDDGYINKGGMDYYVYFDVATGRLVPQEYDGNSAMESGLATSWGPLHKVDDTNYPLMNVLLNIPELRQRYFAHYRTIMEESLKPEIAHAKFDAYQALIDSAVAEDAVREYSYSEFVAGAQELHEFFDTRYNFLSADANIAQQGVEIVQVDDSVNGVVSARPNDSQAVDISVQLGSGAASAVNLYYGTGLMGSFTKVAMSGSGSSYSAQIPAMAKGEFVRYYIEAIADNGAATATYSPVGAEHDVYIYQVQAANFVASDVKINEVMPANASTSTDEEGEYADWVELYNNSDSDIDISGWYLTDEDINLTRWAFPGGTVIAAKSTLLIWADDDESSTVGLHSNFKLSKDGESVFLVTPELEFADRVDFENAEDDQSYARSPNGTGAFSWTGTPTIDAPNP